MKIVTIGDAELSGKSLFVIAGVCVIESAEMCLEVASHLKEVCGRLEVPYIFKASFDKANRTSLSSYRGPGLDEGLEILARVKAEVGVPVLTDVHEPAQAARVAQVADCLQIPAFLCRQTDLLVAAGETGKAVNIKKGQFLAPWDMRPAIDKVLSTGNSGVLLTERGTSFGYNTLVVDMRSIQTMRETGFPVVIDATHSVQKPGGLGGATGGDRTMVPAICLAAVAAGADGVFLEVHPEPDLARSDAANSLALDEVEALLGQVVAVKKALGNGEG